MHALIPKCLNSNNCAGSQLLVAPVLQQGAEAVDVFLPGKGLWYDAATGVAIDSSLPANRKFSLPVTMDSVPSYQRGGTMLSLKERYEH